MASTAQFGASPSIDYCQVSVANTARDGTGASVLLCSGPAAPAGAGVGKRLSRVWLSRPASSVSTVVTFFYSVDGGTTKTLLSEWALASYTASTTSQQVLQYVVDLTGLVLPGSTGGQAVQIYAATTVATTVNVWAEGASL